jgi:hypothetical protein
MSAREWDAALVGRAAEALLHLGWCCDPYGHEDGPPATLGECSGCDPMVTEAACAVLEAVADDLRAEALEQAARAIEGVRRDLATPLVREERDGLTMAARIVRDQIGADHGDV